MQKMLPSYGVGLRENLGLSYSFICLLNGEVSVVFVSKGLVTWPFDDPSQRTGSLRSPPGSFGPTHRDASVCLGEGRVGANLFASGDAPTGGRCRRHLTWAMRLADVGHARPMARVGVPLPDPAFVGLPRKAGV